MLRSIRLVIALGFACGVAVPVLAASPDAELDQLKKQVAVLQTQVKALEEQVKALWARGTAAPVATAASAAPTVAADAAAPSPAYEAAAQGLIDDVIKLTDLGEADRARAKIDELRKNYPASKVAGQGTYFSNEIEVIGKTVPADWGLAKWFQHKDEVDLSGKPTTLVVFWEEWCPHCRDEMPKLQQIYAAHKAQGLQILGVTKVTQTSTDEKVQAYLDQNRIEFPVAKETGGPSTYFNVKGIPAAAIVKGGKIVWRGHPIRLTDELVTRWLRQN